VQKYIFFSYLPNIFPFFSEKFIQLPPIHCFIVVFLSFLKSPKVFFRK